MTASRRIITNTLATYLKLFVLALTGLFAIPVALRTLGATDYGIFSVIGGCLAFLMFLNTSLATGAQRHIAYALGEGGKKEATKWFTTSLIVHTVLGAAIAGSAILASDWILHHLLTLPASRLAAAAWLYRMVVVTMVCNVVSTPYQALLIAHESIASMSLINTVSGVFLMIATFCLKFLPGDALLWYGAIYCLFQASMALGPAGYCYYRYPESRFSYLTVDNVRRRLGELFSFSGWNLFIALSTLVRVQGPAVLLNIFFGPIANAAYGLAIQANSFVGNIVWGFLGSAAPSIVKYQAAGNDRGMVLLSNRSNTYGFGILWIVVAPVLFEVHFCVKLWLRTPPPNTAAFLVPMLVALVIDQLTAAYMISVGAIGRLARFSMVVATANCIGIPVGYFLLRAGMSGMWVLWAVVTGTLAAGCGRLYFANALAGISVKEWLHDVFVPAILCVLGSVAASLTLIHFLRDGIARFALIAAVNCAVVCPIMWFFGTSADERSRLRTLAVSAPVRLSAKPAAQGRGVAGETL
jgi:O-antigen/teichoic acid export membrane protein